MILVIGETGHVERRIVSRPPGTDAAFRALGGVSFHPDKPDACPVVGPVLPAWPFLAAGARDAVVGANAARARRVAHSPTDSVSEDLERRTAFGQGA